MTERASFENSANLGGKVPDAPFLAPSAAARSVLRPEQEGLVKTIEAVRQERDAARLLLAQLVDRDALRMTVSDGHNLLFRAIRDGHEELVRWLAPQCDPFDADSAGNTALTWAIKVSAPGCVRAVLESVANPAELASHSVGIEPALHCAAREGAEMVSAVLPYADASQTHMGQPHNRGFTALMAAAKAGRADSMSILLPLGDVNAQTEGGWSALTYAARGADHDCLKMLLNAPGIDPRNSPKEPSQEAPARGAARPIAKKERVWTHPAAITISFDDKNGLALFEPFVDFNCPMSKQETPLLIAGINGAMECLRWLLDKCEATLPSASAIGWMDSAEKTGKSHAIRPETLVEAFQALLRLDESKAKGAGPAPQKWPVLDEMGAKMASLGVFRPEHDLLLGLAWIQAGGKENEPMPLPKIRASREAAALRKELSKHSPQQATLPEKGIPAPSLRL